jgi:hypothetical protein
MIRLILSHHADSAFNHFQIVALGVNFQKRRIFIPIPDLVQPFGANLESV